MILEKMARKLAKKLRELGLNADNAIVIGSGILQALGIRKSNDIDLVVTPEDVPVYPTLVVPTVAEVVAE